MERISRRRLLTTGGSAAVLGALLGHGVASAQADKPIASPWAMVVDLSIDPRSMDTVRQSTAAGAAPGPFYMSGSLHRPRAVGAAGAGERIGTQRSWGWSWDPTRPLGGAGATHSFDIAGKGEIVVSGVSDSRASIVGGTGDFRDVGGQVDMVALSPTEFRLTFDITSYRIGPH